MEELRGAVTNFLVTSSAARPGPRAHLIKAMIPWKSSEQTTEVSQNVYK